MNKVERLLGIDEFAKNRRSHTLPYWGLLVGGMVVSALQFFASG